MSSGLLQDEVAAPTPERAAEIRALGPWFHNLHLPDGSRTAPAHPFGDFPANKWRVLGPLLSADLNGWTVLDIGCNAGFYAFELARRGALVTGIDIEPLFLAQARWAARQFGLEDRVSFTQRQVYDLGGDPEDEAHRWDIVLFMGTFYHLRYPLLALDLVAERTRRVLVFQTLTMPGREVHRGAQKDRDIMEREAFHRRGWPKMAFIEHCFSGDPTNWWIANHAVVEALLRSTGFRVTARPGHEIYLAEPDPTRVHFGASAIGESNDPRRFPWRRTPHGRAELLAATGRPWKGEEPGEGPEGDGPKGDGR